MSIMTKYHGWIIVERSAGYADRFIVEHDDPEVRGDTKVHRVRKYVGSPAEAVEYFDKRAGEPVQLHETPIGAYRVFTAKPNEKVEAGGFTKEDVKRNALRMEVQRLAPIARNIAGLIGDASDATELRRLCEVAEQLAELTK